MGIKNRNLKIIVRLIFWITYFFSGYILYFQPGNLPMIFINFSKIIYPITIFWLQIRMHNQEVVSQLLQPCQLLNFGLIFYLFYNQY